MVVAGQHQHAAMLRGAGHVGMLEDVAAAIHARPLAVPHAEHAVVLRVREQVHLLRAPYAGGGQVFIDAGMKLDVMGIEIFLCLGGGLVDATERRATITGDEAGSVEAGAQVAFALQHRQPDHCLRASDEGAAALQGVLVVE